MKNNLLCVCLGALIMFSIAATFPFRLVKDDNNRVILQNNLIASNGVTVTTNFVLGALDGVGRWRIVVTNVGGGIGVITNSGAN